MRIQMRNSNGRYRRATLADLGVDPGSINTGILKCSKCGCDWSPLIKQDPCFKCQKMIAPKRESEK